MYSRNVAEKLVFEERDCLDPAMTGKSRRKQKNSPRPGAGLSGQDGVAEQPPVAASSGEGQADVKQAEELAVEPQTEQAKSREGEAEVDWTDESPAEALDGKQAVQAAAQVVESKSKGSSLALSPAVTAGGGTTDSKARSPRPSVEASREGDRGGKSLPDAPKLPPANRTVDQCIFLCEKALDSASSDPVDLLATPRPASGEQHSHRTTVGLMLHDCVIDHVLTGGPAFVSKALQHGDKILKVYTQTPLPAFLAPARSPRPPPPPPSRTNWTPFVPPPVLTGHVSPRARARVPAHQPRLCPAPRARAYTIDASWQSTARAPPPPPLPPPPPSPSPHEPEPGRRPAAPRAPRRAGLSRGGTRTGR